MKYPACPGQQKSRQGFESCQRPEQQGHEYRGDQGGASDWYNECLGNNDVKVGVSVYGDGDDNGGDKEQIKFAQVEIEELCKSEKEVKLKQFKLQTPFQHGHNILNKSSF